MPQKLRKQAIVAEAPRDEGQPDLGHDGSGASQQRSKAHAKKKAKTVEKKYYKILMDLIRITRFLASVQLFDCVWRVVFHELRETWGEADAAEYLFKTYFQGVPTNVVFVEFGCIPGLLEPKIYNSDAG